MGNTIMVKHVFTGDEKKALADRMAKCSEEIEVAEVEKARSAKSFKMRIDGLKSDRSITARKYRDGYEMQEREVVISKDIDRGLMVWKCPKTGEELQTRKLTQDEMQISLPIPEGAQVVHSDSDDVDKRKRRQ